MICIRQLKLKVGHTEDDLKKKICSTLRIREDALLSYIIRKQSLDARKKPELYYIYTVDVTVSKEKQILKRNKDKNVGISDFKLYQYPETGNLPLTRRPVVIGSGPAGMSCAYILAELGYCPILLERGSSVEERTKDVEAFWNEGILNPNSNVQFGEGGAGTFSDGKLNTLVKDPSGRNRHVLEIFVKHGAPEEILYVNKPHIGTDILVDVVRNMRKHIISLGGDVRFHSQVTGIHFTENKLTGLTVTDTNSKTEELIPANTAVLAIGHSARDTFEMLHEKKLQMEAKSFAVGVRVEHPQKMIDFSQYGKDRGDILPAASYKLTAQVENGRSAYTFCMCPGGYVVNASSEDERLAVNGMSYHDRNGENANSAVIVTVRPEDYPGEGPLSGVAFQRMLEEKAFQAGKGTVPVQLFGDFCKNQPSVKLGEVQPQIKGKYTLGNVRTIFPEEIANGIAQGITAFDQKIPGYAREDAVISGVESRTSSPLRIVRGENYESNIQGIYPCGEGAGYAGGITSAAMDGIKVAEAIVRKYQPFDIHVE